jgi:hypothetical protein
MAAEVLYAVDGTSTRKRIASSLMMLQIVPGLMLISCKRENLKGHFSAVF